MIDFSEIAVVIQMAVAPAFLLTGIGAILTVMATRLTRIVDRFRVLNEGKNLSIKKKDKADELLSLLCRAQMDSYSNFPNNCLGIIDLRLNRNDFYSNRSEL